MASDNPCRSLVLAGAITGPVNNENTTETQAQPVADQPKQPKNLQDLIRFAIEATKPQDAPKSDDASNSEDAPRRFLTQPIDPEKVKFLNDALNAHSLHLTDLLKKNIRILTTMDNIKNIKLEDPLPEIIQAAFEELREYMDDIDIARDFEKLGGLLIFPMCYSCESIELHRWANITLAQVCQNNPVCQEQALRCRLMPVLLHRLRENKYEERICRALSGMIRDYEPGMTAFVEQGGCEVLLAIITQKPVHSEVGSAAFLASQLCSNSKAARDVFIKNDIVQKIVQQLKAGRSDISENLLSILVTLLETQRHDVLPIYRDRSLDLKRTLLNHLKIEDVKNGRFIEEKEYCEKVIQLAFGEGKRKRR